MSALENIANPQPEDDAVQRQIRANLGIADPQATPQAPESQNSSARAVADMGAGVLSGGLGALQAVAGLASMVPVVDLVAAPIDRGLGAAREWLGDTLYSDTAKQQHQRMHQAIESSDGGVLEKYGKGFSELGLHGGAALLGEALGTMGGLGKATQLANSARLAAKGLTAEQQAARLKAMTPAARRAEEIKEVAGASAAFGAGIGASRVNAQQDETQGYLSNLSDRWAAAIPNALVYGVTAGLGSKLLGPLDPQTAVNRMMGAGMEGAEVSKLVAAVMNKDWYVRGAFGMGVSMADQTTQLAIQSYSDKASENFGLSQNKWADVKSGKVWEGALDSAASGAIMGTLGGVVGAKAALRPRVDLSGGKGGKGGELQGDTQPAPAPGPRPPAPDIVESVLGDMRSSIRESARGVIERNNITDDFADISNVRNLFNALTDPQNSKHTDYSLMAHLFDVAFSADKGDNSRAQSKQILTTLFGEARGTRKHGTQITDIFDGIAGELNGYQKTHAAAKLLETLLGRSAESRTKSEDALSEAQNEAHAASDIDAARDKLNKAQQEHIMQERMHDALRSVFQDALNKKSSADNTRSEGARKYNEAERAANMDGAEQSRTVANAFLESAFKFLSPRDAAQGESVGLIDAAGKNGEQGHQHIFESFASKLAELYGFYGEKQLQYVFEKLLAMPVGNEPYSNGNSAVFRQAVEQVMFPHMRLGGYQLPVLDATGRIPVEKINELKAKLEERQSASDNMLKGNAKKTAQSSLDALSTFVDAMKEINNRVDEFEAAEAANAQGNRSGFSQFAENARPYEDARAAPTIQAIREAKKAERLRDVDATINSAMTKHEQEQEAAARAAQQERAYPEARDAAAAKLEANGGKLYPGEVPVTPWEHSRAKTGAAAQAELDNIASADRDIQAVEQAKVDRENKTKDWKLRAGRQQQIEETLQSDKEIDARFRKIKGWNVLANELGVDVKGKSIKDVRAAVREYLGADGGFEKLREIAKAQKKTESTTQSQIGSDGLRFSQIAQENIAGYRDGTRPDPATSADTAAHLTGGPPRTPMTKIREAIQRMYGSLLDKLEAAGRVTLTQTLEEALDAAAEARARMTGQTIEQARREVLDTLRMQEAGRIEGFYDPHTMRTYLVADNLSVETAGGTLMHEVGVHMAKDMSSGMAEIVAQARAFVQNNKSNPFVQRALKRMTEAKETSGEEFLAYTVTEYENNRAKMPSSLVQMVQDFVATVRAWLHQHGWVDTGSLTAADLAAIARANARELSEAPQQQLRWSKQARQEFAQTETSSQVKSATGNTGEFNKRSGDIHHSLAQSDVLAPVEPTLNIPGQLRTAANFLRTKLNFVPGLIENLQRRLPSMRSYTTAIERQANLVAPWLRMHDDLGQRLTKLPLSSRDKIAEALVKYSETGVLPDIAPSAQIMSFTQTPGVGVTEAWHPVQQAAPGQPPGPGQAVINNLPLQGLSQVEVDMVLHIVDAMAQIQMKDTEARIRQFKEVFAELRNAAQTNPNIQNVDQMEAKAYAALAALHNERISRGYVPQQRNGKYQVFVKSQQYATEEMNDPNGSSPTLAAMRSPDLNHYIYSAVDSQADAESLVAQYKQQYPTHVVEMKLKPLTDVELGMNMHNLLQMYRRAQTQLTGNQADTILSNQLVESLAQSISKYVRDSDTVNNARMARENIKGLLLSEVLNGVMTRTRSFGDYYGAVMTASDRFDALKKMRIELDRLTGPENTKYTSLYNEFLKLATEVKGEETLGDKVTSKLLGWTAFNYLITNPSFFVLQLAQPFVVSAPVMMGEFGTKGMTQLTNAYKLMGVELLKDMKNNSIQLEFNFLRNNNNLPHARQVMNSKIRDALLDLQARKLLDVGLNQETGFAQNATQNMLGKLPHWLSNIARGVEVINRSTTGAAAYELKMIQLLKGQSITTISQAQMGSYHKQALNYAASIILHTHGDYSHDAAPQIFRSNVGKVALQFKKIGLVFGGLTAKLFTNAVRGPDVSGDAKALFQRLTDPVFGRTPDEIAILNQMAKQKTYFGNISDAQLVTLRRALEQVLTSTGQAGKLNPKQYELLGQVLAAELNPESFITTEKQAAAAKSLAYLLGVSGMAAGAMGIPMLTTILAMIGRAIDSDEDKERYANETDDATIQRKYGPGVARGLAASLAGVDISQRIGTNFTDQLLGGFYNNAQFGKGQDNVKSALLSIGGPAFSLVQDYAKSLEYFNRYSTSESPHDLLKALAYASPLGARNMLLSNLYSREGLVNDAGQTLIDKKDMPNAALKKFFGFQPDEIASFYDMRTNRDQIQAAVNQKRTMLKRAFKEAIDADDADRRQEVVDMWRELQQNQIKVGIVPSNIKELVEYVKAQYKRDALSVGGMTTTTKNRALTQDVADYYDR